MFKVFLETPPFVHPSEGGETGIALQIQASQVPLQQLILSAFESFVVMLLHQLFNV